MNPHSKNIHVVPFYVTVCLKFCTSLQTTKGRSEARISSNQTIVHDSFWGFIKSRTRLILGITFQRDWKTELLSERYCRRSAHLRTTVTIYVGTFGTTSTKNGLSILRRRNVCSRGRLNYWFSIEIVGFASKGDWVRVTATTAAKVKYTTFENAHRSWLVQNAY